MGFTINTEKSKVSPSQVIEYLGFVINSTNMIIKLTDNKKDTIYDMCVNILNAKIVKIRNVARLIGKFTSSFLGVKFGPLHYRYLDSDKTLALKFNKGNYNKNMKISDLGQEDIQWWVDNVKNSYNTKSNQIKSNQIFSHL